MRTRSRIRRGNNTDAVMEFVATICFERLSEGAYEVPDVRLAIAPIVNDFTRDHALTRAIHDAINNGRPNTETIHDAVYVASKMVHGYKDLCDLVVLDDDSTTYTMAQYVYQHYRPPSRALVENREVPVDGLMEILAVSRLIADTDCLGGGFKNTGFVVSHRDTSGRPERVKAVKIDTGFSFNFSGAQNRFNLDQVHKCALKDRKDIQFGNANEDPNDPDHYVNVIKYAAFSPAQKRVFDRTLRHGIRKLSRDKIRSLLWQDGRFNDNNPHGLTDRVEWREVKYWTAEFLKYIDRLEKLYFPSINPSHTRA